MHYHGENSLVQLYISTVLLAMYSKKDGVFIEKRDQRLRGCADHGVFLRLLLLSSGHSRGSSLPESDSSQFDEGSHAGGNEGWLLVVISKLIVTLYLVTSATDTADKPSLLYRYIHSSNPKPYRYHWLSPIPKTIFCP